MIEIDGLYFPDLMDDFKEWDRVYLECSGTKKTTTMEEFLDILKNKDLYSNKKIIIPNRSLI